MIERLIKLRKEYNVDLTKIIFKYYNIYDSLVKQDIKKEYSLEHHIHDAYIRTENWIKANYGGLK